MENRPWKTWREEAGELFSKIDKALDGGEQIQLIAAALQDVYERGIGDGIAMEAADRQRAEELT